MIAPPRGENLDQLFASAASVVDPMSGIPDLLGALLAARPAFHADALCQEHPEVNFFPAKGESVNPAKRNCGRCLVRAECRSWALDQDASLQGVWAGTTSPQRRRMRAAAVLDELRAYAGGPGRDVAAAFLAECCSLGPERQAKGGDLYAAFAAWVEDNEGEPMSKDAFAGALGECGLEPRSTPTGTRWTGAAVRPGARLARPARRNRRGPVTVAPDPAGRSTAA